MIEKIQAAAIWYDDGKKYCHQPVNLPTGIVVSGHRHPQCLSTLAVLYGKYEDLISDDLRVQVLNNTTQGFITNKNRFVDRKEGAKIALESGQITELKFGPNLYSEDLY